MKHDVGYISHKVETWVDAVALHITYQSKQSGADVLAGV